MLSTVSVQLNVFSQKFPILWVLFLLFRPLTTLDTLGSPFNSLVQTHITDGGGQTTFSVTTYVNHGSPYRRTLAAEMHRKLQVKASTSFDFRLKFKTQ